MIQKVFATIAVFLILLFIAACKPVKDESTIRQIFSLLNETRYDEALKLMEGNAETLMRKLTKEQSGEIVGIVFKNLVLDKVSKDELLTSREKDSRIYRAGYHLELKYKNMRQEVVELLSKVGNGEVLIYVNKKTGKIAGLIDLKGGVFVAP
ncbi:MAG: hypothetical protein QMD07_03020 [Thermodesulfovibrionales bacterium]|nr:hypothetical protein [Thermodesulfovibrionales bacterium]